MSCLIQEVFKIRRKLILDFVENVLRIEDADFAAESARLAKAQVLQQTGTAMLAQANASQQLALSLFR